MSTTPNTRRYPLTQPCKPPSATTKSSISRGLVDQEMMARAVSAVEEQKWSISRASRAFGVSRRSIRRYLNRELVLGGEITKGPKPVLSKGITDAMIDGIVERIRRGDPLSKSDIRLAAGHVAADIPEG